MAHGVTGASRVMKLFRILVALALALALVPVLPALVAQADPTSDETTQTSDQAQQIADLLSAGDYVEGQVVAAVYTEYADTADWFAAQDMEDATDSETLMETSADTYVSATDSALDDASKDDTIAIILITSDQMTTEEMLDTLLGDERILSVEPDYVTQMEETSETVDQTEEEAAQEVATLAAQSEEDVSTSGVEITPPESSNIADVTSYQWGLDNDGSTMHDGKAYEGFDINSPGWDDADIQNACGVVAIMDTGIDYTNPDLDDVMVTTMDQYNPDGGIYGMNVSGIGDQREVMDDEGHGTHCAGIVASEWNAFGTSGVANGCKLAAVKVYDSAGALSISSMARGYAYLSTAVDNGLNLVAVNNSWGDRDMSKMMSILVTQLGEKGVVSVFSAGNASVDSDYNPTTPGSFKDNPYAIVVNGSDRSGENSYNYGIATTDVMAPGVSILSTGLANAEQGEVYAHYLSETDDAPLTKDVFEDTTTDSVKVYNDIDENFACTEGDRVGTTDTTYYYEGGTSLRIASSEFGSPDHSQTMTVYPIYLKIPVSQVDGIMLDFKVMALIGQNDNTAAYNQYIATADTNDPTSIKWSMAQYDDTNLSSFMVRDKHWSNKTTYARLSVPQGRQLAVDADGCVTMKLTISAGLPSGTLPDLYLDCLSVGTSVAPYLYASGTSMAAPMVSGAAAVAAYDQGVIEAPHTEDAARLARERVLWLKQHVNQYDGVSWTIAHRVGKSICPSTSR